VLVAMGVDPQWSAGAVRFSLGHGSSADDVDHVLSVVPELVARLRRTVRI
jgi:cysteine desulfurase